MQEEIKSDLLSIWSSALELIEEGEYPGLLSLSNHTIHNSSIYGDELSISAAVIIYSLGKMAARTHLNVKPVVELINRLIRALNTDDEKAYRKAQRAFFEYIKRADSGFRLYIDAVLKEAKIKKGWKVYDHGLSLGASAKLLGVSQWELMNYIGNTTIADRVAPKTDVKSRLEFTRRLFHGSVSL